MEKEILTPEDVTDIKEVRDIVKNLPESAKAEIVNGMAMFEAGYKSGFVDGMSRTTRTA